MQLATSFVKDLPAKLNEEERQARSDALARLVEEIADVETEAKKIASQYGQKLKGMRQNMTALAHAVTQGEERRPVLCSERADMRRFTVETYRHDDGAVVDTRAMTQDEVEEASQANLFPSGTGIRVATEEKKKGLDLVSPTLESVEAKGEELRKGLEELHEDLTSGNAPTIENPGAVLDGSAATPEKPKRTRRRRGGQDVPEDAAANDTAEAEGDDAAPELAAGAPPVEAPAAEPAPETADATPPEAPTDGS